MSSLSRALSSIHFFLLLLLLRSLGRRRLPSLRSFVRSSAVVARTRSELRKREEDFLCLK